VSILGGCVEKLRHGLVVSCQADDGDPLDDPRILAAIAATAVQGGAVAIRACGAANIRAIKAAVDVPVIGLTKQRRSFNAVYITPTWDDVVICLEAGADIVALDATTRARPDGLTLAEVVARTRAVSTVLLLADIARLDEALLAAELGFDLISTTLSGYTDATPPEPEPDLALVADLSSRMCVPVIAEGRIATPAQAAEALRRGAWAVCVGKAITTPGFIAAGYVKALHSTQSDVRPTGREA
jgi:N-acylglucosamine-6-phosphate 2-epimerase